MCKARGTFRCSKRARQGKFSTCLIYRIEGLWHDCGVRKWLFANRVMHKDKEDMEHRECEIHNIVGGKWSVYNFVKSAYIKVLKRWRFNPGGYYLNEMQKNLLGNRLLLLK